MDEQALFTALGKIQGLGEANSKSIARLHERFDGIIEDGTPMCKENARRISKLETSPKNTVIRTKQDKAKTIGVWGSVATACGTGIAAFVWHIVEFFKAGSTQ